MLKMLRDKHGWTRCLMKPLILQVIIKSFYSHLICVIFLSTRYFDSKWFPIKFQRLQRIRIGSNLQEALAKYNYEGWMRIYLACAGTNTQRLINMLESMFRDGPKIDPEELDTEMVKETHAEAQKAEEEAAKKEGTEPATNKSLIITKLPLVPKHGIDSDYWSNLVTVTECNHKKNKKVEKLYY